MPGIPFTNLPAAQMMDEQYNTEQRQITQWFDSMRFSLEQQELEPEQHMKQYALIMKQAQTQAMQVFNRHQANAQFLQQLDELVEDGSLMDYQAKKIAFRMAGVQDSEALKQLSGEPEEIDWVQQYHRNVSVQRNVANFLNRYQVEGGKLYAVITEGKGKGEIADKKNPEGLDVVQHYNMALNLLDYYKQQERAIYGQLYPMEQAALEMERVAISRTSDEPSLMKRLFQYGVGAASVPGKVGMGVGAALTKGGLTPTEVLWGPEEQEPVERVIRMRKPNTDEMVVSYDGGKTWLKER